MQKTSEPIRAGKAEMLALCSSLHQLCCSALLLFIIFVFLCRCAVHSFFVSQGEVPTCPSVGQCVCLFIYKFPNLLKSYKYEKLIDQKKLAKQINKFSTVMFMSFPKIFIIFSKNGSTKSTDSAFLG